MRRTNWILACLTASALACTPWLTLNVSSSAPRGLWRKMSLPPVLERDMWVVFPVPTGIQGWITSATPLLKPIAALPGDWVCVLDDTLWIRGASYGHVYTEVQHRPLPHVTTGCFQIAAQYVFVASPARYSLDSRYFGSVPSATLTSRALPLLTER